MKDTLFLNRYFVSIASPVLLLLAGALAKKLIHGDGWKREDFYLGAQFALAAMAGALTYLIEEFKKNPPNINKIFTTAIFLPITYVLLLFVLSIHQQWETEKKNIRTQIFWLCIISNLIGSLLIFTLLVIVKGE